MFGTSPFPKRHSPRRSAASAPALLLAAALAWTIGAAAASGADATERLPDCVQWADAELSAALRSRLAEGAPPGDSELWIAEPREGKAPGGPFERDAESFAIGWTPEGVLVFKANHEVGAMYGLLELAEQIRTAPAGSTWPALRKIIRPMEARPAVRIRAVNIFLHLAPDGRVAAWFHDEEFWRRFLDLLARSRFNVLDLHGAYCPATTIFSNLLPHFTGGGPDSPAAANRAMLRRIVGWAAARGVRVALMDYDLREPAGGQSPSRTAAAGARVQELLRDCPGLWGLGWRVKRSGSGAVEAFRDAFVKPCRSLNFPGVLYTRSWGTDRETVGKLARAWGGRFMVEVKFNGEHLGEPYPALHGWGEDYSFQDFLLTPRSCEVIWQVRSSGTLRIFPWCDPGFVRRAVGSFRLGGAAGFSIEPHWAYSTVDPGERYRDWQAAMGEGQRYLFERDWAWYAAWGRLSYDPNTPDAVLARGFVERHGPNAGPLVFEMVRKMSRIVPAVYCAYAAGVDQRDFAPEMEIGLYTRGRQQRRSLEELCAIPPLDRSRGCSPAEFAAAIAERREEPRRSPRQTARELLGLGRDTGSAASEALAALMREEERRAGRTLEEEARALACLAFSTASRLEALTSFALYRRTGDARWLPRAQHELECAKSGWCELAGIADKLYLPIADPLRAGPSFTWASVLDDFERLEADLREVVERARKKGAKMDGQAASTEPSTWLAEVFPAPQVSFSRPGDDRIAVALRFPEGAQTPRRLAVLYKPLDSERAWRTERIEPRHGVFSVKLDRPRDGLLVQFQAVDEEGRGWLWPTGEDGLPYYWVIE